MKETAKYFKSKSKELGKMIDQPASKEWFEKHGLPKHTVKKAMQKKCSY